MKIKEKPEDFIVDEVIELPKTKGDFLYVKLKKENRNTVDVINEIVKKLNLHRKDISFAGTKDKKAVTTQYISIFKGNKEKIKRLKIRGVELTTMNSGSKPLRLGDLKGNKFKIKIDFKPKKITQMINYFGPQRFSENNAEVGKAILKKDFKKASSLLKLEVKHNDYLGTLQKLDKKILSLLINSYQSFLWNKVCEKLPKTKNIQVPLFSFDAEFKSKKIESLYAKLLTEENITKRDFIIRHMPDLSPLSNTRPLLVKIEKFSFKKPFVSFFLPKGSYATVALEQML